MTERKRDTFLGFPIRTPFPGEIEAAKKYGQRVEGKDGDCIVVSYAWRGAMYIVEEDIPYR